MRDYNFQKHLAHEKRDDGCHSPAAVLQWIKGVQPEPELVYQAFSALCETRRLNYDVIAAAYIGAGIDSKKEYEWFSALLLDRKALPPLLLTHWEHASLFS